MGGIRDASAGTVPQQDTQRIVVEIADAARLADLQPSWLDLLERAAAPNIFMDPALLRIAAETHPESRIQTLLAWKPFDRRLELVGVWAFAVGRARKSALPINVMIVPPCPHSFLAAPVIDRTCLDEVLDAVLDRLDADPRLPKIVALDAMEAEGPTMEALVRVLAGRSSAPCILDQFRRPMLASDLDGKRYLEKALSGSSRKKLRQHRRRLAEMGTLTIELLSEPEAVSRALEDFLTMEASGWKGRRGTAILCKDGDAMFMRAAISALAEQRRASIHALYLDRRPISMQIIVRSGRAAFTWKTAYDEQFHDFSPGMLLFEEYTASLLADASIAFVDSCAHDDSGFMSAWTERQPVADLWIDAQRGGSLAFRFLGGLQKSYRDLRAFAKNARNVGSRLRPQPRCAGAQRSPNGLLASSK